MSSTTIPPAQLPSMTHLVGGFIVQMCIGFIITGVTYSQAYSYSLMAARDPWLMKTVVALVVILETTVSAFCIHIVYSSLVENFGNFSEFSFVVWSVKGAATAIIATMAVARIFNVYRIYHLTRRNLILTIIVAIVSIINMGVGFVGGTLSVVKSQTWIQFLSNEVANIALVFSLALGAFNDLLVASILIYRLTRMKTGFSRTNHLIAIMIAYVVNTGALTVIFDLLVVIFYCTMKDSFMYQGAYVLAGRMYGVAVIGTLNQRRYFKDTESAIITDGDMHLSDIVLSSQSDHRQPVEIFKTVAHHSDGISVINVKFGDGVADSVTGQEHSV